ncbi:jg20455 [Pararge aegeria aegeria]|uniref:mitogen-activated protein kinase kinase n=1 Tax=Pararge aegeria aegeria TaxID=348720 RepID=A0A8S4S391_9NEOP|nr:jg20455 [Pararge aegeria aegeria]
MSESSIEGKLRGLQERLKNEMCNREGAFHNQGGLGASRSGSSRRPRPPPMFSTRDIPAFPPRSPQAVDTEYRMREVYKVSGKLNVDGTEYKSHIDDLQQLGELGSGTCGHVVKMLHRPSGAVIAVKTVNALSYLKDTHGVIHRDVKPSNILLDERGNVKLCDFGISGRLVDSKAKTRSAGCAAYMAPERIDPPDPSRPDYDIRADVWSLGISLVELATGVFPYRDCQNDFEVLTRVIADDPPQLPDDRQFTPEFKSFVSQCLTKNYRQRPKYAKLLEHPFVVKSARSSISVGTWYASLPLVGHSSKYKAACVSSSTHSVNVSSNGVEVPKTPVPVRNFVTSSQHWTPEQATPTPGRAWWASTANPGGSSSQPASLEADLSSHSPYPRRRTIEACASPPPAPARRVSADSRWRASPASSGNTSPIVLQRFYHQSQQRRSRVDLHSTPRHRSLSREHSSGRSPEPPPRTVRLHHLEHHKANGSMELEPPPLHDRLHPPSPLLLSNDRLSEGRSQSLTRAELRNGYRTELTAPVQAKHHHDDQGESAVCFLGLGSRVLATRPLLV